MPIEKPISLLSQSSTGATSIIAGVRDPFLYNPRKALQGEVSRVSQHVQWPFVLISLQVKTVLVQNEPFELVVTLRNPYIFDLELQSLQLRSVHSVNTQKLDF